MASWIVASLTWVRLGSPLPRLLPRSRHWGTSRVVRLTLDSSANRLVKNPAKNIPLMQHMAMSDAMVATCFLLWDLATTVLSAPISICARSVNLRLCILQSILFLSFDNLSTHQLFIMESLVTDVHSLLSQGFVLSAALAQTLTFVKLVRPRTSILLITRW